MTTRRLSPAAPFSRNPRIPQITVDTSAVVVLKNISAGNPVCQVCNDRRREDCAPSALGHMFETTMADLDSSAKSGCSLCDILHRGCRHFSRRFRPDWNPAKVEVQYSESLSERAYRRDGDEIVKTYCEISISFSGLGMAPIQLLLSPQERERPPVGMGRRWHHDPERSCPQIASVWLTKCQKHQNCNSKSVSPLPTRVLAIGGDKVRLYESQGKTAAYVALSYCWGDVVKLTTTSSTLHQRKHGIHWNDLPRTFRDAITMSRKLGILYIWIDSLCIIQDSKTDWEVESARMASVFRNACLTIAASGAPNSDCGLFDTMIRAPYIWRSLSSSRSFVQVNNADLWRPYAIHCGREDCNLNRLSLGASPRLHNPDRIHDAGARTMSHFMAVEPSHDLLNHNRRRSADELVNQGLPLFTRAWFLQERILSRRILHFGRMEMYWECRGGLWCECLSFREERREFVTRNTEMNARDLYNTVHSSGWKEQLMQPSLQGMVRGAFNDPACQSNWQLIIEEYSRLRLSHEMDRLPALSGIADCGELSNQYLAGLWQKHLPSGLCWTVEHNGSTPIRRPAAYRAPSFSWAAIEGPINFPRITPSTEGPPESRPFMAVVLEAACELEGLDPRGRVIDGHITLEGWLGTAVVRDLSYDESMQPMCVLHSPNAKASHSFPLDLPLNAMPAEVCLGQELTLLLLQCDKARLDSDAWRAGGLPSYYYHAVVLVLKMSGEHPNSYKRVGLIWPTEDDLNRMSRAEFSLSNSWMRGIFTNAPQWFDRKSSIRII